ncbi:hypothetical protein SteCoe_33078 [Stentor coeruleus]|uniref:Uncharacterized protein n=1 Tax=Stentor coeruleus TaxID=5963 RepID=A0A1R2AXR0_9CILI|nr:hypothetical protein SteCoe_33078 [Stentor coeruleus]
MWILLLSLGVIVSGYTRKETACYVLVTQFMEKKAQEIQETFSRDPNADSLGLINCMVKDSFTRCNNTITSSQASKANKYGALEELLPLVEFDVNDYKGKKVEPNYDFIKEFRKIQSEVPTRSNDL